MTDTVLTAVVSKGVNLLGNALTEAGKDKTWKALGSRNLRGGSAFPVCVQVMRGRFRTDAPADTAPWLGDYSKIDGAYEVLKKNGLWPVERPDFFFEGAIVTSEDKSAAAIRPLFAVMNASQGTRATGREERSVVVFFAFSKPGMRPDLEANPAATVVLGPMLPSQILRFSAQGSAEQPSTPHETAWFTMSDADARKPLTVTSLISETQSGSPFFAFLASIFNEDTVKKAVTDRANVILIPSAQAAAEESATAEKRTALNNADSKLADAIAKLSECHAAGKDVLTKGAAAKAAARAYLAADAASPTPAAKIKDADVDAINLYTPESITTACNDLHEALTGKRL